MSDPRIPDSTPIFAPKATAKGKAKVEATTSGAILALIEKRYSEEGWVVLKELANATGTMGGRRLDAVACGIWPSRGLLVKGFEVKIARADWRRELADPKKAEETAVLCDHFYVVAPPGVVQLGELPEMWGLLETHQTRLAVVKEAKLQGAINREDRAFMMSLVRKAWESRPDAKAVEEAQERGYSLGYKAGMRAKERAAQTMEEALRVDIRVLQDKIRTFEEDSGIKLDTYNSGNIGRAFNMAMQILRQERFFLGSTSKELRALADQVDQFTVWIESPDGAARITEVQAAQAAQSAQVAVGNGEAPR